MAGKASLPFTFVKVPFMATNVTHFCECSSPVKEGQGLKTSLSTNEVGDLRRSCLTSLTSISVLVNGVGASVRMNCDNAQKMPDAWSMQDECQTFLLFLHPCNAKSQDSLDLNEAFTGI